MLLLITSIALLFIDHRFNSLSLARSWLTFAITPVQWISDLPSRIFSTANELFTSRTELLTENTRLKAKNLILEQKVQKLASLTAQNLRLKELLHASELMDEQVLVAEIIGMDPDPYSHIVTINKGSLDGVFKGQAIVDAHGVMGQVIHISPISSQVMLVTDVASRVPVQVNRSGYRAIAVGTGSKDFIELMHIPDTVNIQEGDLLMSSGLGHTYPVDYPLGKVKKIIHTPGEVFAKIQVQLLAAINRTRFVLLVFRGEEQAVQGHES